MTAGKLAVMRPSSDETSFIEGLLQESIVSHASLSFCPLSCPVCDGTRTDFKGWITNPNESNNFIVAMTLVTH